MKIRIKGNSLRYRLTRPEVERFSSEGRIEERINFGPASLTYALCKTTESQLSATFTNNRITLYLPEARIDEWTQTDKVGFEYRMPLNTTALTSPGATADSSLGATDKTPPAGTDETLYLLVEKDYTCLDNTIEDQTDNYTNPLLKKSV